MHIASHGVHGMGRAILTARTTCAHILPVRYVLLGRVTHCTYRLQGQASRLAVEPHVL